MANYKELGYDNLLSKSEFTNDVGSINTSNADQIFTSHTIPFDATTMNRLVDNEDMQSESFVSGSAGWKIEGSGDAEFNSITVRGTIYATVGEIGGWTIASDRLSGGSGASYIGLLPGTGIQLGNETFGSAPFSVTNAGVLVAESGTVGGWTLASDKFFGGSGATYIGLIPGTGIQLGNETFGSAPFSVTTGGVLTAESGTIGGFTLGATEMYGGIIKTAATVQAGSSGVIMDTDGLRGYDSVLGNTFDLPTDGSAPTFSSGIINETIYEISTNAILRTSSTVGDGTGSSDGVLINDTGIYGCETNQDLADANFKILATGGGSIILGTAGFIQGGQTDFATGTGFFLGYSSDDYKLSVGSSSNYLRWNGTDLTLKGSFDVGANGVINNSSYAVADLPIAPTSAGANSPSAVDSQGNTTVDTYSESNFTGSSGVIYSVSGVSAEAQSFTNDNEIILDSCKFYLTKTLLPTGNAVAKLYAHSGTYGSTSKPTGAAIATSDNFDVSTLDGNMQLITFSFTGTDRVIMDASTHYVIAVEYTNGDTNNFINAGRDSTGPTHDGCQSRNLNSVWQNNGYDLIFYVYGTTDFSNPTNAYADDASYATNPAADGQIDVLLSKDGGTIYTSALTKTYTGSETSQTYGDGSTELWGTSFTGDDVDDASLRLKIQTSDGSYHIYKTYGFAIAAGAILTGIEVSLKAKWDGTTTSVNHVTAKIYYGTSTLPVQGGSQAYASDGRKAGEGGGSGTGVLVFNDGSNWIACDSGATVAA